MRIFVIATVAKQNGGDFMLVKIDRAFKTAAKADEYLRGKAPVVETINTEFGLIECNCESGAFEVEVED